MKGISHKAVEECMMIAFVIWLVLDSVNQPSIQLEEDDIADWYSYLESKNQTIKKVNSGSAS